MELHMESKDYLAIKALYTDKTGKLNYELFNKDLIKFAHTSSRVRAMIANKESVEDIRTYIVGMKLRHLLGNKNLTDEEALAICAELDNEYNKNIFKSLNEDIRQKLNANKKGKARRK